MRSWISSCMVCVALALVLLVSVQCTSLTAATSMANAEIEDASSSLATLTDASDTFFDDSYVHEIYLTFDEEDYGADGWYNTLYDSHNNDPDDPYFPASFEGDGVSIEQVGVRFKGNSSFRSRSVKKSFKIDFDEYDEDNDALVFYDLKKLNLNNGFNDPTLLREKLFLDFAGEYVAAPRAVHTKVYVNGEYYGLYVAVEQVDKTFVQNRFGDDEDGNLFKGATADTARARDDFNSDLTWLGADEATYEDYYILKTNESDNDYSELVAFIDALNNTSPDDLPTKLEPLCDVDDVLQGLALNSLFVNLDSYNGSAHNYYLYDRDDTGQLTHIPWDTNESFGRFARSVSMGENLSYLDPLWLPSGSRPGESVARPLMENLWANEGYHNAYLCHLQDMLDSGFDEATMTARIDELADLIRDDVYADPNKLYSNAAFETNLHSNVQDGRSVIYGLSDFVRERSEYLQADLASYGLDCETMTSNPTVALYVNEFMADNETVRVDPDGTGYSDWIEIYNASAFPVDLKGLYLTDDLSNPTQHAITQTLIVPANGYLVLYADEETERGVNHLGFKLAKSGEDVGIYDSDGATLIDSTTYGEQTTNVSEGRCPDGGNTWVSMATATPGESNAPCGQAPGSASVSPDPSQPAQGSYQGLPDGGGEAPPEPPSAEQAPLRRPALPPLGEDDTMQAPGLGDALQGPGRRGGQQPGLGQEMIDLAAAAETLGVTEAALTDALGEPPDFQAAADTLGVSLDELMAALGMVGGMPPAGGPLMGGRPGGA